MVMWKDIHQNGLKYVHQLFEHQRFKSEHQVWTEFKLTKLRYNSLKMAIPKTWKQFFQTTHPNVYNSIPPHNYDMCIYIKNLSSKVYKCINGDLLLIHSK